MQRPLYILHVGKNTEINATVNRLINAQQNWKGETASTFFEVREKCLSQSFDIILIGGGIDEETESQIRALVSSHFPNTKIIEHYGGGSGLLTNEILEALK